MQEPEPKLGGGPQARRDVERHLVKLWNELRVLAEAARCELDIDPVLLHFPVLTDEPTDALPSSVRTSGTPDRAHWRGVAPGLVDRA